MKKMKKNTIQLIIIITLLCCAFALLGCGIWLNSPETPTETDSSSSIESILTPESAEDNWTNNY